MAVGGLSPVFQPILELGSTAPRPFAFECLMRGPRGTNLERADVLFDYVRLKGEEAQVDRKCLSRALEAAEDLPAAVKLSVNIHASTLCRDLDFVRFVQREAEAMGFHLGRLILEIVEHTKASDTASFRSALRELGQAGVQLAVDDFGIAHSNYRMILECRPDYLKIDRYFVHGCWADDSRRAVLHSIASLAHELGARVIAEGIEDPRELEVIEATGIDLVQGFLFGKPTSVESVDSNLESSCSLLLPTTKAPNNPRGLQRSTE
jgi:EAL domain-containing protein (putative c-di-GMP-specific phosphodiesterase class I)